MTGLTLLVYAWIFGGAQPDKTLAILPWTAALALEALLFLPQRREGEDMFSARERCWGGLSRDPLSWLAVAVLLILALPFFNRALCLHCHYDKVFALFLRSEYAQMTDPVQYAPIFAKLAAPSIPQLPFCLEPAEHLTVVMWFLPSFISMLAAKHALTRHGKRTLMELMAWNGAALAILGFIEIATDAKGAWWTVPDHKGEFFSSFGYANMAGSYFALALGISIGVWRTRVAEAATERLEYSAEGEGTRPPKTLWIKAHYTLAAVVLNFFGGIATSSRAGLCFAFALAALGIVYVIAGIFVGRTDSRKKAGDLLRAVYYIIGAALFILAVFIFAPKETIRETFSRTSSFEVVDRIGGKSSEYQKAAWRIFRDHPLWGVGGWGYSHLAIDKLSDADAKAFVDDRWGSGTANVHNDYLQFLCEHGIIVMLVFTAMLVLLLAPLFRTWYNLSRQIRFEKRKSRLPAHPYFIYVLPPGAFWIFLGCICVFVHAFADCPLRSPANLSLLLVAIACISGYLPNMDK